MKFLKLQKNRGFVLVEVVVATAMITIMLFSFVSAGSKGVDLSNRALKQLQMNYLLEEGVEAVKTIRNDNNWTIIPNLQFDKNYYLYFDDNTNKWSLSLTPNTIDGFTRTVVLFAVTRDGSDKIAASGTIDDGTRKIAINVSRPFRGITLSKSIDFYITNLFK